MSKVFDKFFSFIRRYENTHNATCDLCAREVFREERICDACMNTLPFHAGEVCPFCGRSVREAGTCIECKHKPLKTHRARSVMVHEGEAVRAVVRFKNGDKYLYRALAALLANVARSEFADIDVVIGVPMTEVAQKRRGYNQAYLLAEEVARLIGKPYRVPTIKVRDSAEQKSLGREAREENLRGCFRVTDRAGVKGKKVLIIDDTLTTGSTSSELARVLYAAKCERVDLLTVTSVPMFLEK